MMKQLLTEEQLKSIKSGEIRFRSTYTFDDGTKREGDNWIINNEYDSFD